MIVLILSGCKKSDDIVQNQQNQNNKILPTVKTNSISNLTLYSVILSGELISNGSATVTERGFVISTVPGPTITNTQDKFKEESGSFTVRVHNHLPNTTYYMRAYAISADGVGYGQEIKYTTPVEKRYYSQLIFTTQQQVFDFGQQGYNRVNYIEIGGSVSDLSPLKDIVIVDIRLQISSNSLTNLYGLHNIERVTSLHITQNSSLQDLRGLEGLEVTSSDLVLFNNSGLTSLNGLNNLLAIGVTNGSLFIENCQNIQNLHGLEKVKFISADIKIRSNNNLSDLSALQNLKTTYGRLEIINNPVLPNLNGFQNLKVISDVIIDNNFLLTDISALSNIDSLLYNSTYINIINNPKLKTISCFNNVTKLYGISIKNNAELTSLNAFGKITELRSIFLENNPKLTSLSGLESLRIAQTISINQNILLSNFCPLKPLFLNMFSNPIYTATGNALNPTSLDIINNCP
jgi:hypothetical protein